MIDETHISEDIRLEPRQHIRVGRGGGDAVSWRLSTAARARGAKCSSRTTSPLAKGEQLHPPSLARTNHVTAGPKSPLPPHLRGMSLALDVPLSMKMPHGDAEREVNSSGPMLARRFADSADTMALLDPFEMCHPSPPQYDIELDEYIRTRAPSENHLATVVIGSSNDRDSVAMVSDAECSDDMDPDEMNRSFSEMMFT